MQVPDAEVLPTLIPPRAAFEVRDGGGWRGCTTARWFLGDERTFRTSRERVTMKIVFLVAKLVLFQRFFPYLRSLGR